MNLQTWWARQQMPYERLSLFAGNLATCLEAGLGLPASLESTGRALHGTHLADSMQAAAAAVKQGNSLADALSATCQGLPSFFIPVIAAGEATGRLDVSLRYLEDHCRMLAGPAQALRNAWLLPLAVIMAGTAAKLVAHLWFASWGTTIRFVLGSLTAYGTFAVFLFVAIGSPFRPLVDYLKLYLPLSGPLERNISVNRFFHALAMLHAAAGQRVEKMIRVAARTVSNLTLRADFDRVACRIEQGDSIAEAFDAAVYLAPIQKQLIATGDLSGTLERSYQYIADDAASQLQRRLEFFQLWFVRVTLLVVVYSTVHTCASLFLSAHR